jgi:hypothetical protein
LHSGDWNAQNKNQHIDLFQPINLLVKQLLAVQFNAKLIKCGAGDE